jgi:sugar lactone lactonase YvrE
LEPNGLVLDSMGRIYVADTANQRIVRIDDMTGTNWTTLGVSGQTTDQFFGPSGVFVDAAFRIYVVDEGGQAVPDDTHVIRVSDMTGANWTSLGNFGTGVLGFNQPIGIWVQ